MELKDAARHVGASVFVRDSTGPANAEDRGPDTPNDQVTRQDDVPLGDLDAEEEVHGYGHGV